MGFLSDSDYSAQIRNEVMAVLNHSDGSQGIAEQMAEAEIGSYLRARGFDVTAIFAATGAARNSEIIMIMIDITLYHLHSNIATRQMPTTRQKRYDDAISWLNKVAKGQLEPDLPRVSDEDDPTPTLKLGSNKKYSMRY